MRDWAHGVGLSPCADGRCAARSSGVARQLRSSIACPNEDGRKTASGISVCGEPVEPRDCVAGSYVFGALSDAICCAIALCATRSPGVARQHPSSFACPKEEGKKRAPQVRRPCGVPCDTRTAGRLRNSPSREACEGSDSPRRKPPAVLRFSAALMGPKGHTAALNQSLQLRQASDAKRPPGG